MSNDKLATDACEWLGQCQRIVTEVEAHLELSSNEGTKFNYK